MRKEKYQTIIYELEFKPDYKELELLINRMTNFSNIYFICYNQFDDNNFICESPLHYTEELINIGFKFVNTIIVPQVTKKNKPDNILYILWFVKDYNNMLFLKDNIREKHIWKNVDWGKRDKNYNPKGKDPGNFWLPTDDNGKGQITNHNILSYKDIIERCIVSSSKFMDNILIRVAFNKFESELLNERNVDWIKIKKNNIIEFKSKYIKPIKNHTYNKSKVYFSTSEDMSNIDNDSVQLMITSPPYWDLKNYFKDGQIGQERYFDYLMRLNKVWKETYRVLNNSGSMWININTRTKNKSTLLIPYEIIKQCTEIGFKLKNIIIWHKSSGIPTHKNNIVDRFEYFLWFVKSESYYFNKKYFNELNDYKNEDLIGGYSWNINRKAGSIGKDFIHPAIYPTELIERIINLCSVNGNIVLDPFLGSGTTLIAAIQNSRLCFGYEYNEQFESLIKHRINASKLSEESIEFISDNQNNFSDYLKIFR